MTHSGKSRLADLRVDRVRFAESPDTALGSLKPAALELHVESIAARRRVSISGDLAKDLQLIPSL